MKKIINGKTYNTDTATEICSDLYSNRSDFDYCWETLYVTRGGAYFLYGEGGPLSKYSVSTGQNSWSGGVAITPMTAEEARIWVEENGSADTYAEFFGEPEEAEADGASQIKDARETAGLSRKELSQRLSIPIRTLEDWEAGRRTPPVWAENLILAEIDRMKEAAEDE